MMRLMIPLFSPATGTWGGLTRAVAIAQAAPRLGHEVAFCASGSLDETLRQRGYRVYTLPAPSMFGLPGSISRLLAKHAQKAPIPISAGKSFGNIWFVHVFSGMTQRSMLKQLVACELEAIKDFQPDKVFTDLDLAAYLSAAIAGIPIASAFQGVMLEGKGSWFWKIVRRATADVQKHYRVPVVPPEQLAFGPQMLKIIPSIPELEGVDPARPDICYVGQLLGEIKTKQQGHFSPEAGKRYLFVYLGTGALPLEKIYHVVPNLLQEYENLEAVVGGVHLQSIKQIGAVQFQSYVSAQAILPYCDWTVCHGGQNTIIQSLLHNVPLLIFPGPIFERRFNAKQVQEYGAGKMGEVTDFNRDWLRSQMTLHDQLAVDAQFLGEKIRRYGGAPQAVEAIAGWKG
jgi:UDP:flavonoid glycosyltransferase YjiC (YdhE family)